MTVSKRRWPLLSERPTAASLSQRGERRKLYAKASARARRGLIAAVFFWLVLAPMRAALRLIWAVAWRFALVLVIVLGIATYYFYLQLPDYTELVDGRVRGSVTMLDRNGEPFAWRGENFDFISAREASPYLINAIIAIEDRRFWWHFGISLRGIAGAIRSNLAAGRGPFQGAGGSTITQQVAKLLCLGRPFDAERWASEAEYEADCRRATVWRKLQEVPFAFALELRYTKEQILTLYLNRAFLGAGARGFEAAAQRYFGRSAREVGPAEAAMLAGLLVAPSYYSPTRNLRRAQERAQVVIRLMEEQGYLEPHEADEARQFPATLSDMAEREPGGWFADWLLQVAPSWLGRATTEDVVVRTTFDRRAQAAVEEALAQVWQARVREGSRAEVAVVVMSPDGAVRAMVGGRRYIPAGFNRATQARRQTGSAFKPFVYAVALERGYSPLDGVDDTPLVIHLRGSGPWAPRNFSGEHLGRITLVEALARSQNVPAVRVAEALGRAEVRRVANAFGLHSDLAEGPALALGASEATLLEMTAAYAGILNWGRAVRPYGAIAIALAGQSEPLLSAALPLGEQVISEEAAAALVWMMTQVLEAPYGTGRRARLPDGRPAAGKTGTSQEGRDAWFIGFTADYVVGVWMGNDDNTPLQGVTGGGLPAEIWREVMVRLHAGRPIRPLPMLAPSAASAGGREFPRQVPQATDGQNKGLGDVIRDLIGAVLRGG